jgi:hypothetical protein
MSSPLSANQMRAKYGIPQSDLGSEFARNEYQGPSKVQPYAKENRSTRAKAMAWENPQAGVGGSFMKFDDGQSMAPPTTGA